MKLTLSETPKSGFLAMRPKLGERLGRNSLSNLAHFYWGLDSTKPVFEVFDKERLKPVSSATETSKKMEISPVAILDIRVSKKRTTKELISLHECAFVVRKSLKTDFLASRPTYRIEHLRNEFNFWNVHGIMNTSGLVQGLHLLCTRPEVFMIP